MSDMNFRWKGQLPALQPNFVDPQGVRATMAQQAAQKAQGYTPLPNLNGYQPTEPTSPQMGYRGMAPTQDMQDRNAVLAQQNYDAFMGDLRAKKQRLAKLEAQLQEIDSQIAQIESGSMDEEKAIAAKMAEIGDMSGYQAMLSRQQNAGAQQKSATQGIENMLYDAEKLTWGLGPTASDEERAMVMSNIEAVLVRAKEQGAKAGIDVTKNPSYQRLEKALKGENDTDKASLVYESQEVPKNVREASNTWYAKARKGQLTDNDLKWGWDVVEKYPNSKEAEQLRPLLEQYKSKTRESKAAFEKRKNDALALWKSLRWLDETEKTRRIGNLTRAERKLLEDFHPDILK